jgi:acyl-CoA synthetase (AMP-forming)/AMP-acid ligase II
MGCGNLDPTAIERVRPQLISLVPFRLRHLLDALPDNYPQWPLRLISTAGPIPIALASRIREMLTADLRHAYGTSEAGSITGANLEILENDEATAGFVLPFAEVDIVDDGGTSLPRGELGQIRVRGEEVVRQYLDPVQGASSFHAGWFYPGDLGRLTEDGLLTLEGRVDDLMNIGGEKVLPAWVEKALVGCPGVADAAAFACPDENGLDVCWLGIVRTNDYSDESLSRALEGQLVTLNMIKVLWLESMPRNALGKVDRNELRAMARAADGLPQSATT